jgi:hypothetical protein
LKQQRRSFACLAGGLRAFRQMCRFSSIIDQHAAQQPARRFAHNI